MADERLVVLNRSDNLGFGFSLLGEAGLPHIIYKIEENSPAARSGEVSLRDFHYNLFCLPSYSTNSIPTFCDLHIISRHTSREYNYFSTDYRINGLYFEFILTKQCVHAPSNKSK